MLPQAGSVAGIDVGFSERRRSSAICRLDWNAGCITWNIKCYRAEEDEREAIIQEIIGDHSLLSVAIDGPLCRDFVPISAYRPAEMMLTRRLAKYIGKPGQSSAPVGRKLNAEANRCAELVLRTACVAAATHDENIAPECLVEAFPSSFLGVMLTTPKNPPRRRKSDIYFQELESQGVLEKYLNKFFPGRSFQSTIKSVTNHDKRAALVRAFTAVAVAANDYCAVGGEYGWIILPPRRFIQSWAWNLLECNQSTGCGELASSASEV